MKNGYMVFTIVFLFFFIGCSENIDLTDLQFRCTGKDECTGGNEEDGSKFCRTDRDCAVDEECVNSICQKRSNDVGIEDLSVQDTTEVKDVYNPVDQDFPDILDAGYDIIVEDIQDVVTDGGCEQWCGSNNTECVNDRCVCKPGFDNCDNDINNGCEANLMNDINNCGLCHKGCGQNSECNRGVCTCLSGFYNCNDYLNDGCEVNLSTDPEHCGNCNTNCRTLPNTASVSCSNSQCIINSCKADTSNCNGDISDGCEVNHSSSENICGSAIDIGNLCGDENNPSLQAQSGYGSKWFKIRVEECDSSVIADKVAVEITLDIYEAVDYDLLVYSACGNFLKMSSNGPGTTENIRIYVDDEQCYPGDCNDTFDLWVEVRYISDGKDRCGKWILNVYSQDGWY